MRRGTAASSFAHQLLSTTKVGQEDRIQVKTNGKTVVDHLQRATGTRQGHLALQIWNAATIVHVRKIEIKELPTVEPGWTLLFNNKDLTGWTTTQPEAWKIADGILRGQTDNLSYLWTVREDYRDFHLRLEARVEPHTDGGLRFRRTKDNAGYEAEIHANGPNRAGSLWRSPPTVKVATILAKAPSEVVPPAGEWFTLEVIARGNRLKVLVNQRPPAEVTDAGSTQGGFGLQIRGKGCVEFRKIEIKELPPEEAHRGVAGEWGSTFGWVTMEHRPIESDKAVPVTCFYVQQGNKALITKGTFDPAKGRLQFEYSEPWLKISGGRGP